MAADFFELLKKKIRREPDRRFDQVFWQKFESEFGTSPGSPRPGFADLILAWLRPIRYGVALAGVSALAIALHVKAPWKDPAMQPTLAEIETVGPVIASLGQAQSMLDNLELLETLDDVELSEQDWKTLIGEENQG